MVEEYLIDMEIPKSVESKSLMPVLKNPEAKIRNSVFFAYKGLQRGIRTDDNWKLIKYMVKGKQTTQLFDLNQDPHELQNLAENEKYNSAKNKMEKLLESHMIAEGDFLR